MQNPSAHVLGQCPICQTAYKEREVRLLGEKGSNKLFHCTCRACGHAMIAVVLENGGIVSSIGMVTDLEARDAIRCQNASPITPDECVRAHTLFRDESKQFCAWIWGASPMMA